MFLNCKTFALPKLAIDLSPEKVYIRRMKKLNYKILCLCAPAALLLCGCGAGPAAEPEASVADTAVTQAQPAFLRDSAGLSYTPDADGVITLTAGGTYTAAGECTACLCIDAGDETVELVLENVSLTGTPCALYVRSAASVLLRTADGTENIFLAGGEENDGAAAVYSCAPLYLEGEGALTVTAFGRDGIYCKGDFTLASGALTVATDGAAVKAKGNVYIAGGAATLNAAGDGIAANASRLDNTGCVVLSGGALTIESEGRGIDAEASVSVLGGESFITAGSDGVRAASVLLTDGVLTLTAGDEGIQAEKLLSLQGGALVVTAAGNGLKSDDAITIEGGLLNVASEGDGVECVGVLSVSGGQITVMAGGGGGNAISHSGDGMMGGMGGGWGQTTSTTLVTAGKGLKSDDTILITGGTLVLNSSDDAVHCANLLQVAGGDISILTNDDALHCDTALIVDAGTIYIEDCFEGLEAYTLDVNGGDITINAVNDGINANGPESMGMGGGWGQQTSADTSADGETYFRQTGGVIRLTITGNMQNLGDGVDSNGSLYIDGGELYVSTSSSNGSQENGLDYGGGSFIINGGIVLAGGSSTMAEAPESSGAQCAAQLSFSAEVAAGSEVTVTDSAGAVLLRYTLADAFNCLVVSLPDFVLGETYTVTAGDQTQEITFTSTVVSAGSGGWSMGGMMGGMGGRR